MFNLLFSYWFGYWVGTSLHKRHVRYKYRYLQSNESDKYKNNQMEFRFNR